VAKHSYGFSADRERDQAVADAITMAKNDGFIREEDHYDIEVIEYESAHEFVVVVRSDREGLVTPLVPPTNEV
jgi:hypothetical protein